MPTPSQHQRVLKAAKFIRLSQIATLLLVSSSALAQNHVDTNKTINRVGVQFNSVYFGVTEGFGTDCLFENVYVDGATEQGKLSYSLLLTAQASGKKLSRIDYHQPAPGEACTLHLVEISPWQLVASYC